MPLPDDPPSSPSVVAPASLTHNEDEDRAAIWAAANKRAAEQREAAEQEWAAANKEADTTAPYHRFAPYHGPPRSWTTIAIAFVTVCALLTIAGIAISPISPMSKINLIKNLVHLSQEQWKGIVLAGAIAWSTVPPLWFLAQYYLIYLPTAEKNYFKVNGEIKTRYASTFEYFKYGQDLASKIWAGMYTVIAAVIIAYSLSPGAPSNPTCADELKNIGQLLDEKVITQDEATKLTKIVIEREPSNTSAAK